LKTLNKGLAKETTKRTDERGAGGRWVGRHRLTMTDDEDISFGSLRSFAGPEDEPLMPRAESTSSDRRAGVVVDGGLTTWIGDRGDRGGGGAKRKTLHQSNVGR
jgi:hypothetical protein